MSPATARLDDEDQRLAALWESDVDGSAGDAAAHDDETATFFPVSGDAGMRAREPQPATRASRWTQRPRMRPATKPRRLAGAAVCGLVAAVVVFATHGTPARHPHEPTPVPRPRAARATAAAPPAPAPPNHAGVARRRHHPPAVPHKPEHPTRTRAQTSRAHMSAPRPRPSRRPTAAPSDAAPRRQPAPPPVPVPPATSSACDEFPPC